MVTGRRIPYTREKLDAKVVLHLIDYAREQKIELHPDIDMLEFVMRAVCAGILYQKPEGMTGANYKIEIVNLLKRLQPSRPALQSFYTGIMPRKRPMEDYAKYESRAMASYNAFLSKVASHS